MHRFAAALVCALALASPAEAQDRHVEVRFSATRRAQIAVWIESTDGAHFRTVALTQAVSLWGIGNRPGALQMNSGHHWPYGRREGVLPVWAHRRYDFAGTVFRRVIFNGRDSEGNASSQGSAGEPANSPDPHFCISFTEANNDLGLDGMSCASVFLSNKGRYVTDEDVAAGYAEPFVDDDGTARMRGLSRDSLYPPRRDVVSCGSCEDHPDAARYASDAAAILPELDAVTMATPADGVAQLLVFDVPSDWPEGDYTVFLEVNAEGDYAPGWDATSRPTPTGPAGMWDYYAGRFGYPYRGQPSVIYEVPIAIDSAGGVFTASSPVGFGGLHGETGEMAVMDGTIMNDPLAHPGSGADRLYADPSGTRVSIRVPTTDVCAQPEPPVDCGRACTDLTSCPAPLLCGEVDTCVDQCAVDLVVAAPEDLALSAWPDPRHTHQWAELDFRMPSLPRGLLGWEVRVSTAPITDEASFLAGRPAQAATAGDVALEVPRTRADGTPLLAGDPIHLELGGMSPSTRYHVGVRAIDACSQRSVVALAEIETTEIHFTTVAPCFIATAAYGSPLDARLRSLRRFRDRYLMTNVPGQLFVEGYYAVGPSLAEIIARDERARDWVRVALEPVVALASWLDSDPPD